MGLSCHQIVSETLQDLIDFLTSQVLRYMLAGMENQRELFVLWQKSKRRMEISILLFSLITLHCLMAYLQANFQWDVIYVQLYPYWYQTSSQEWKTANLNVRMNGKTTNAPNNNRTSTEDTEQTRYQSSILEIKYGFVTLIVKLQLCVQNMNILTL